MDVEISLIEGYQVGLSVEERLVALLVATRPGDTLNAAMTAEVGIQLGEDLIRAGARLQDLKARDN